ncbi:MAG TPA: tRNA (adenosine(37)-N6)-threonylcarbamoyltransferase complex dimerization subunit type 1 TsaB, partial [Oceanithermus profundus]|nr:tRNA (adenosine(37)-N6)-threonylcarbamoyltransferase complex dimerization subunit type 1 TsaB [Oceanithermus profundus]
MNVLAIDTATPYLVLGTLDAERTLRRGRRHAETLIADLEAFLAGVGLEPGQLELIVVGEGPGSYTGIRVAVATAMGLARGLGVPVVGAPSLAA